MGVTLTTSAKLIETMCESIPCCPRWRNLPLVLLSATFLAFCSISGQLASPAFAEQPPQFNRDIRPVLAKNCFACHGQDESSREAGLRLDNRSTAIEANAIALGKPDQSELILRIESEDPASMMPPPGSGRQLTTAEVVMLRRWITEGANYERHWSFEPPAQKEPPQTKSQWSTQPIDRFILSRLEAMGLKPNEEENRLQLIRRLSLDITGLPPSTEDADAFLADTSPEAYEVVVDRLLESDAYGEHWARPWLDLARYADTKGYEKDRPRTIWRYRDWVIDALNQDLPYDQFSVEQLAGDLLPNPTNEQILATAFHRNTMENDEGGTDDEEFRVAAVKDRVDTTIQVWMGLTMGCAKCHSHKYDPISQEDYYSMYAIFNQTADADRQQPTVPTPTKQERKELDTLQSEIKGLEQQLNQKDDAYHQALAKWHTEFERRPLWSPLRLGDFVSTQSIKLDQNQDGTLNAADELPEKDTWKLTLELPADEVVTAIRFDTKPKSPGGKWSDKNVVLSELSAELLEPGKEPIRLKLVRPRADFSQAGWAVANAIDGNTKTGWAFSPKADEPHCVIFDLEKSIEPGPDSKLRLTLEQQYGQGLVLKTFVISTSSYPSEWLRADIDTSTDLAKVFQQQVYPATKELHSQIDQRRRAQDAIRRNLSSTPIMRELAKNKRRETRIHTRGNFLEQGELVEGSVLEAFGELADGTPLNRLGVAYWLMQPNNPLTARVAVNRMWAQLFGIGLVETEEDFGTQGTLPSHPELLDWLAVEFRTNKWSSKKLLKTIVMSSAYRQSSATSQKKLQLDPQNRWLSRGPRFRLSAETVRDQALAVSGLLTKKIGGPSVMPPQPSGIWKSTYSGEKWKNATDENRYRRSLYTYKKRTSPYPAMMTFDSGSGEVCQIRRIRTNTPLQALVTLNDTTYLEAAGALSRRMEKASDNPRDQIANGFRRVLIRHPETAELDRLVELYESLGEELTGSTDLLEAAGLSNGDPRLVAVANVLLNLDETLMKP